MIVRHELADGDRPARRERGRSLAQQPPAPVASFAMQDMANRRHLMARAKIRLQ